MMRSMSYTWEAQRLVDLAEAADASDQQVQEAAQELYALLREALAEDITDALRVLAEGVAVPSPSHAALIAMLCGALVENGADPAPVVDPLLARLHAIAPLARQLHEACIAGIADDADDRHDQFTEALERVSPDMPEARDAWELLERLFPPVIAVMSVSPDARARGRDLLPVMEQLDHEHGGAHWIAKMLRVLDNEPFIAIEPATRRGIAGRMSGVSENFQLNVLLMEIFPGPDRGTRVSPEAAAIARGDGPQQSDEIVAGKWNLYEWSAIDGNLALPPASEYGAGWIWNEGTPADIPKFRHARVILIGPSSYERTWRAQRDFTALRGELHVERVLSGEEVARILQRLAEAKATTPSAST